MMYRIPATALGSHLHLHQRSIHILRRLFSTYYDSQSGKLMALHNEDEISLFAHQSVLTDSESPAGLTQAKLISAQKHGFNGVVLGRSNDFPSLTALLADLSMPSEEEFGIFVPSSTEFNDGMVPHLENLRLVFEFSNEAEAHTSLSQSLVKHAKNHTKTAIEIADYSNPILVSNGVASLIDATEGGELVLLNSSSSKNTGLVDPESVIALCEELSYLDIPGQTMKSRIVVDLANNTNEDETLEECLTMGLNKFVICNSKLDWFKAILQEHGKNLGPEK